MDNLYSNFSLKNLNSFGVDAQAEYFYEFEHLEEIKNFIIHELPKFNSYKILGAGNNILLNGNVSGVVIRSKNQQIEIIQQTSDETVVRAGAGIDWDWFVEYSIDKGWFGLENLSLIPGSVGAAPVQNIGAYGVEVERYIKSVEVIDLQTSEIKELSHANCYFGYRNSIFKSPEHGQLLITSVIFCFPLKPSINLTYKALSDMFPNPEEATPRMVRQKVIEIRESKLPDPKKIGNAGSFFKNPVVSKEIANRVLEKFPNIPRWEVPNDETKFAAAWFIEQCGFKGYTAPSGAGVYKNQPLVLVNHGMATGKDIMNLAMEIIAKVNQTFGVKLEPEVNVW
jgi:UDP-N-acetylmuramate dehydrogenase